LAGPRSAREASGVAGLGGGRRRGLMGALMMRDEVEIVVEAYRKSEQPSD
jgi:hypothetical protein